MADGDWSNIPREIIDLDTLGQEDSTNTTDWDWEAIPFLTLTNELDPFGQVDTAIVGNGYSAVTLVYALTEFPGEPLLADGTYIGEDNGFLVLDLEFQPLPELNAITSSSAIQIVLLAGANEIIEFWG